MFSLSINKHGNKFNIYLFLSNKKRIILDDENLFKKKQVEIIAIIGLIITIIM